jgi:hypothetical protein
MLPGGDHEIVGIRPGEKLHEVMVSQDDARVPLELPAAMSSSRYSISGIGPITWTAGRSPSKKILCTPATPTATIWPSWDIRNLLAAKDEAPWFSYEFMIF